jgi:hypothetical protein
VTYGYLFAVQRINVNPVCEDVIIPDALVKVDGCLMPAVSPPEQRDTYVNELIFYQKGQRIGSNVLALLRRISALTKYFLQRKRRKQFLTY